MVTTTPRLGSVYLAAHADKSGAWLEGDKHHTLHVPPNPPAEQFWPISKIMPSDGCKGDAVPLTVGRGCNFRELGCHLGKVGLTPA